MKLLLRLLAFTGYVSAVKNNRIGNDLHKRQNSNKDGYPTHLFDQPIDHFPHKQGREPHTNDTFKQRYVFDSTYYKPGGPVFLYIGGETAIENRFSNLETGIIQILMQATNGLGVVLENRYYGKSFPFPTSTTDQLRFLSTDQTIADNAYFAKNVAIPGFNTSLAAPPTPWILYGGSLAGAQTAFSLKTYPHILWGGIASSGITKAKLGYPEWYDPIQKYGPQDCVGSLNAIVDNIDLVFSSGNSSQIYHMKRVFGLQDLKDNRDFAATIAFPLGGPFSYPTETWQELGWDASRGIGSDDFWLFCHNVTNAEASHNISQVDYELARYTGGAPWTNLGNYANYIKNYVIPICDGAPIDSSACFGTQNQTYWADPTNSGSRSYFWTTCTEQGDYQVARTDGQPTLLSRIVQVNYTQQWCDWAYPAGKFARLPKGGPNLNKYNRFGGYNVSAERLAHIDGDQDVWKQVCFHSDDAPERTTTSTEDAYLHPQLLISGAGHHWDSYGIKDVDAEPQFVREAHKWEIRVVKKWLEMFEGAKKKGGYE